MYFYYIANIVLQLFFYLGQEKIYFQSVILSVDFTYFITVAQIQVFYLHVSMYFEFDCYMYHSISQIYYYT